MPNSSGKKLFESLKLRHCICLAFNQIHSARNFPLTVENDKQSHKIWVKWNSTCKHWMWYGVCLCSFSSKFMRLSVNKPEITNEYHSCLCSRPSVFEWWTKTFIANSADCAWSGDRTHEFQLIIFSGFNLYLLNKITLKFMKIS